MLTQSIDSVMSMMKVGRISSKDLLKECLKRARFTDKLNCFVALQKDNEVCKVNGKLAGVPIAVKDNFCMEKFKTTCASRMLADFHPSYNATVVQKLIDAGASIVGMCNMDEFAMGSGSADSYYGPTINIWRSGVPYSVNGKRNSLPPDPRIPGGSSGGSAVAVAVGACYAALGSDTGGSVRNPGAHCGVVGFKPSYSACSRYGLIPLCNSLDVPGIFTRHVSDAALIYNVIHGKDPLDPTSVDTEPIKLTDLDIKSVRIGIPKEFHSEFLTPEILHAWKRVASLLEDNGATVTQESMPHVPYSISCYSILNTADVSSNMGRYDGLRYGLRADDQASTEKMYADSRSAGFGRVVRARILAGNYYILQRNYEKYFIKAMKVRRLIAEDFLKAWESVDILLTPTTLMSASRLSDFTDMDNRHQCLQEDYCTLPANLAGVPSINLPVEVSDEGLPLGVQLMAPIYKESHLLNVAAWLEKRINFPKLEILDTCTLKK